MFLFNSLILSCYFLSLDVDGKVHASVQLVFDAEIDAFLIAPFTDSLLNIMKERAARNTLADGTVELLIGPLHVFMDSLQAEHEDV